MPWEVPDALKDALGSADANRLTIIAPLFENGQANLSQCVAALYGDDGPKSMVAFRKFKEAFNDAGESLGLKIESDTKLKSSPKEREIRIVNIGDGSLQSFTISVANGILHYTSRIAGKNVKRILDAIIAVETEE